MQCILGMCIGVYYLNIWVHSSLVGRRGRDLQHDDLQQLRLVSMESNGFTITLSPPLVGKEPEVLKGGSTLWIWFGSSPCTGSGGKTFSPFLKVLGCFKVPSLMAIVLEFTLGSEKIAFMQLPFH